MDELPFKKEYHYEMGKWIKNVYHFGNGILYEEIAGRDYIILFYNSERKNFYFKGNFLEKNDIAAFEGTMHFKKDDKTIGNMKINVKEEFNVELTLDGVKHIKPSKVSFL